MSKKEAEEPKTDPSIELAKQMFERWKNKKTRETMTDVLKGCPKSTQRKALLNLVRLSGGMKCREFA